MLAGHSLSLSPRKTELRSCVNREVAWTLIPYPVLLPSLKSHTVSVDVNHHETRRRNHQSYNNCVNSEVGLDSHYLSRSSPVPKKPYGFCGRKAPSDERRTQREHPESSLRLRYFRERCVMSQTVELLTEAAVDTMTSAIRFFSPVSLI